MNEPFVRLRFPSMEGASGAFDLLQELGYEPEITAGGNPAEMTIRIDRLDVQSALEITHAYSGHLAEEGAAAPGWNGEWNIPAHLVAEDFTDEYLSGTLQQPSPPYNP